MLKKAGIIAAAATAGVLALSPLAFAGESGGNGNDNGNHNEKDKHHHSKVEEGDHHDESKKYDNDESKKYDNGDETTVEGNQTCTMSGDQGGNASGRQAGAANLLGGIALALPLQIQVPIGNCLDFSDDDVTKTDRSVIVEDNKIGG